jgi:23S rRNA pseudouridine955/2504/2580 synthase
VLTITVSEDAAGQRLDKLVRKALRDVPLSHVYKMFRTRKIRVNGGRGKAEQLVAAGDTIVIRGDEERLLARPEPSGAGAPGGAVTFGVLHEDADVLAVDKPAGLAAHPGTGITGATLVEMARAHLGTPGDLPPTEFRPSPAHRLDRDTSGVVLVAKSRKAMVRLTEIFTDGEEVKKTYLALVKGKMPREAGTIDLPLSEHEQTARSKSARGVNMQEALTRWKVVSSMKDASLLAVSIETGRTHQIRRHLEAVGHPVLGDKRYGDFPANRAARQRWGLRRMFLHAWKLALPHPTTGAPLRLEAPLPGELEEALARANLAAPNPPATSAPGQASPRKAPRPHGER